VQTYLKDSAAIEVAAAGLIGRVLVGVVEAVAAIVAVDSHYETSVDVVVVVAAAVVAARPSSEQASPSDAHWVAAQALHKTAHSSPACAL